MTGQPAYSKRVGLCAWSQTTRQQNQAKEDWKKLILAANVCYVAYFFVKGPQVSLAVVDSNF